MHYNQKKLDYFSRVRQLRVVFRPWKARHLLLMQVKAKMRYKLMQFTRWVMYDEMLRGRLEIGVDVGRAAIYIECDTR